MENLPLFSEKSPLYGCLASQHGLGYAGFARLMARFGSPEGVYAASEAAWREAHPLLSAAMVDSLARGPRLPEWETLLRRCDGENIAVTAPGQPGYPKPLLDLEAPPPLLYLRGSWEAGDAEAVALVGTRTPTAYGREAAFALARDLAAAGYAIVSGLALGVDAAAHAGALAAAGGRTLAVIGCGLDIAYPVENLAVRARIEQQGGVLSEFPPGTEPWPGNFPRRNRLISALARATVVVEAGGKSGALLTAAHAHRQGKPLFAVPGPIFSAVSAGTNTLLRKGALLAASPEDIVRVLQGTRGPVRAFAGPAVPAASRKTSGRSSIAVAPPEARPAVPAPRNEVASAEPVLRLWGADTVCGMDALAERAGAQGVWTREEAPTRLLEELLRLELRGLVRRLPGAAYQRVDSR